MAGEEAGEFYPAKAQADAGDAKAPEARLCPLTYAARETSFGMPGDHGTVLARLLICLSWGDLTS
jgi:hypothetical protein